MAYSFSKAVEEIKNRADLITTIQGYIPTQRSGRGHIAKCPFHNDSKPSLHINPQKGIFKCFACGTGGDLFKFIMLYEKIDFNTTIRKLAEQYNIEIEKKKENRDAYQIYYDIHKYAQQFYQQNLKTSETAQKYLKEERKLSDYTINLFGLGYSPQAKQSLYEYLKKYNINDKQILIDSGLFVENEYSPNGLVERFRGRIMIPIYNAKGDQVIAFGSRVLHAEDTTAKYINSPDTPIFQKNEILYNYHQALTESRQKDHIILLEGYFDVIFAYQAGLKNTVASLGTAFGENHARLLYNSNLTRNIYLFFDNDEAGYKALWRSIGTIDQQEWKKAVNLYSLNYENISSHSKDIDELLQETNNDLDTIYNNIKPSYEYIIDRECKGINELNSSDKIKIISHILELINPINDKVKREIIIQLLAERTSISISAISDLLNKQYKPNTPKNISKKNKIKDPHQEVYLTILVILWKTNNQQLKEDIYALDLENSLFNYLKGEIYQLNDQEKATLLKLYEEDPDQEYEEDHEINNYKDILIQYIKLKNIWSQYNEKQVYEECQKKIQDINKAIRITQKNLYK